MSQKNVRKHKRSHSDEEKQTSKKRKIRLETSEINSFASQRTKEPRLSPALFSDSCEIQHGSLRQLIKYAVLGKERSTQASWCSIHHQKRLRGVVVVVLEDLSQHHFYQFYMHFLCLRRLFKHRFSLPPPSTDFISSLVGLDLDEDKASTEAQAGSNNLHSRLNDPINKLNSPSATKCNLACNPILRKYGKERHCLTRYLLSEEEMRTNDYPCVVFSKQQSGHTSMRSLLNKALLIQSSKHGHSNPQTVSSNVVHPPRT